MGPVSSSTFASASSVQGHGVVVLWQKSDEAVLAAASAASSPTTMSIATGTTTPQAGPSSAIPQSTSAPPRDSPGGASGLSTGAKAGIGVGVPLAVLAFLLAGLVFWRRRGRADKDKAGNMPPAELGTEGVKRAEIAGVEIQSKSEPYYARHELAA